MNIVLPTDEMIREINNRFVELCLRKESCMKDLIAFLEPDLEQYIDWNWIHSLTRITALIACEDRLDMVRFCIEHGSDIDYLGEVRGD